MSADQERKEDGVEQSSEAAEVEPTGFDEDFASEGEEGDLPSEDEAERILVEDKGRDEPLDEVEVRELLRRALRPPQTSSSPSLLGGVQRKLRVRSKGKFYADGWSTSRSPRSTYLVTSLVMLFVIAFVFLVLIPWGSGALY